MKKYVLTSGLSEMSIRKLSEYGIETLSFPENRSVEKNISGHADISFAYLGEKNIYVAKEMSDFSLKLKNCGFNIITKKELLGKKYPLDVPLNIADTGEYIIADIDTAEHFVIQWFKNKQRKIVNVRQGYTKCSVVPVNKKAIITDDENISSACLNAGLDVLLVSKGSVVLPGFPYGFIGGASGRISDKVVAFNGSIYSHPDGEKIVEFLNKYGMECLSLTTENLKDIGSIIPLY